jgi:hypothetical protein
VEQTEIEPLSPHCELDARHKRKYLPFRKLQPPRKINGFPALSRSLPARTRRVLLFLSYIGHLGIDGFRGLEDAK